MGRKWHRFFPLPFLYTCLFTASLLKNFLRKFLPISTTSTQLRRDAFLPTTLPGTSQQQSFYIHQATTAPSQLVLLIDLAVTAFSIIFQSLQSRSCVLPLSRSSTAAIALLPLIWSAKAVSTTFFQKSFPISLCWESTALVFQETDKETVLSERYCLTS